MAELIIYSGKLKGQRLILPDRAVVVGRPGATHVARPRRSDRPDPLAPPALSGWRRQRLPPQPSQGWQLPRQHATVVSGCSSATSTSGAGLR